MGRGPSTRLLELTLELSGYLATARRWWWTLLVATWIAGLAGYLVATRIPATYEARSLMLVGPVGGDLNTLRGTHADATLEDVFLALTREANG